MKERSGSLEIEMKRSIALAGLLLSLAAPTAARAGWDPRQTQIVKAANEVLDSYPQAFVNVCKVADGKARLDAADQRLKSIIPAMEKALTEYAVYEIFVLRAPKFASAALPPERCRKRKRFEPEIEARMARYEAAVAALVAEVAKPD
jgi:hypothetical protein